MTIFLAAVDCAAGFRTVPKCEPPQPPGAVTSSPEGAFPCRPGRLRGTCLRVQPRAQRTVGEPFGRLGITCSYRMPQTVLALLSTRICQRADLFAIWSQPRAQDIGISAIAILRDGHLGFGGDGETRSRNFRLAKPALCR